MAFISASETGQTLAREHPGRTLQEMLSGADIGSKDDVFLKMV